MKGTFGALLFVGALAIAAAPPANAASNFTSGNFNENDPARTSFHDQGVCIFFAGPRGTLAANRFLMKIGDRHSPNHDELQITGELTTLKSRLTGVTEYLLFPDDPAAATFFQNVLRRQLHDPKAIFTPFGFTARVSRVFAPGSEDAFACNVSLTGRVHHAGKSTEVSLTFHGGGQFIAGIHNPKRPAATPAVSRTQVKAGPSCPTSSLAPDGLDPLPGNGQCTPGSNCLLNFKGYQWWTSFNFRGQSFPDKSYYWNDALKTAFAPKNAFVDASGLHLTIQDQDLGAGSAPAGSEVALMFNSDGSPANLGYGKYLVTATVKTADTWNALDLNAAFGVFTFERIGTGAGTGTMNNPNREIDLAEVSRFGWPPNDPSCPSQANPPQLCKGNAQFTLQNWWQNPDNVHRYSIGNTASTVTLVMTWRGQSEPVTFQQYNKGGIHLSNLPATADSTWTSVPAQNIFIPATNCERFHLNLWMGNYRGNTSPHPPPKPLPYEVVVTNFEFSK